MKDKTKNILKNISIVLIYVLIFAGGWTVGFFLNCQTTTSKRVDEVKDKSRENITANCFDYIMYAAKQKKWHIASHALCLCQQTADKGNQNLCKNAQGMMNYSHAVEICRAISDVKRPVIISVTEKGKMIRKYRDMPVVSFKKCMANTKPGYD